MNTQEIIKDLSSLVQLDIDAIHAYEQAIEKVDVSEVRKKLTTFMSDHERHVTDLSRCIRELGGKPPEFLQDFKGFLIEGMTIMRSVTGTSGALKAMKMNEELTNAKYNKALGWPLPGDIRAIVELNREDERRHLEYIEEAIEKKVWKQEAA